MQKVLWLAVLFVTLGVAYSATESKVEYCTEGRRCETTSGEVGLCMFGVCVTETVPEERRNLSFTIIVKYPEDRIAGKDLYIRGNGLGLNWQVGSPLVKTSTDTWEKTITYRVKFNGFTCENCEDQTVLLSSDKFEYRILIDDTQDMTGANFALEIPLTDVTLPESPKFEVYPWFYETSGAISSIAITSVILGDNRNVSLYLPPSFSENPYKKYGVLFMYDGEFDSFEYLEERVFDKYMAIEPIMDEVIIVGWGFDTPEDRAHKLTPVPGVRFRCINGTFENACNNCYPMDVDSEGWLDAMLNGCGESYIEGGGADLGLDFLLQEALPKAVEAAGGRLLSDRDHVGIIGYSFGGLAACYAVWSRPDVFSYGACESSSLYWPMDETGTPTSFMLNVSMKDPELLKNRKPQKIYIDAGELESGDVFHLDGFAVAVAERLTTTGYFQRNENVWYQHFSGHNHGNFFWYKRIWSPFSILLAPKGTVTSIAAMRKMNLIN